MQNTFEVLRILTILIFLITWSVAPKKPANTVSYFFWLAIGAGFACAFAYFDMHSQHPWIFVIPPN